MSIVFLLTLECFNIVLGLCISIPINPLTARLFNWNFHPPEVLSR